MTSSRNHHQSVEDAVWLSLPEMEADFWGEVQRSLSWRSLRLLLISFSDFKTKTVSTTIQQWKDAKKLRRDRRCFLCRSATKRISSDFSKYKFSFFSFIWDTEDTTCHHITVVRSYNVTLCDSFILIGRRLVTSSAGWSEAERMLFLHSASGTFIQMSRSYIPTSKSEVPQTTWTLQRTSVRRVGPLIVCLQSG